VSVPTRDSWTGTVLLLLASSTGGVGQHVLSLTRGLVAGGATVVVGGPLATEQQFRFTAAGATFVPVEIPANPTLADASAVRAVRRALLDGADVVHAHGLRAGLVALLSRPAAPVVVTLHNSVISAGLRGGLSRLVERRVVRSARVVLGASPDLVTRATALGASDARLGAVAAPELPPPARSRAAVRAEFGIGANQPLVLSVGRLHPQKRYDLLVDAAARWRDLTPPAQVAIAGTGPSYLSLAAQISAARAPVTLLGHRNDVADLLLGADLAVVSSDWEARQLFAQEALRAGVPLVATAVGGLPELVGDAALLVPPGDLDALDAAVRELLADHQRRADLAASGPLQARSWPTESDTVAAVGAIYREVTVGLQRSAAGSGTRAGPARPGGPTTSGVSADNDDGSADGRD
jgi:glycosyltransferase involved in cell wall biosynthesis